MISSSTRDEKAKAKKEDDDKKVAQGVSSSSRQWSAGFRNPRIVRVSRSFGGKDRHSKVCTVRGLRDRRIRLSVPTAIQLYDLQDRLGLSQPSKVIDWLIDNTKTDIDKLPPLQMPPGLFAPHQFHPDQMLFSQDPNSSAFHHQPSIMFPQDDAAKNYWDLDSSALLRGKSREQDHDGGVGTSSAHRFFPTNPNPNLFNNTFYHWGDPSNLSLSQFGNNQGLFVSPQTENHSNSNSNSNPVGNNLTSMPPPQLFLPTLFPAASFLTNPIPNPMENQQMNHFQTMKPFSLNVNHPISPLNHDYQSDNEDHHTPDHS